MLKVFTLLWALLMLALGSLAASADSAVPKLDVQKLEAYVRYVEGYTPQVKLAIDAPVPSAYKGFFRVVVHLSLARDKAVQQVGDKSYYTPDGERFTSGPMWSLDQNPFADTLARLPSEGPSFGPPEAKVTIVVFSDFQCPYCREFAKTLRNNLPQKYPKDVRVIFENFPIESIHPWAFAAAEAGHCFAVEKPAIFWAYHDWIFEHQGEVTAQNVKEKVMAFAQTVDVPGAPLSACWEKPETAAAVRESLQIGRQLAVQQTPSVFLNGRMLPGAVSWETLNAVIQLELGRPKEVPGPTEAQCCGVSAPTVLPK